MTFPTTAAALCLIVLATSGTARAERFEVGIGGGAHFVPMDSMDALSDSMAYGMFSLEAGLALPELSIVPGFESEASLVWDSGSIDGTTFNRIDSHMEMDTLTASGRLRRRLASPVSMFLQAGLGVQWADLQLRDAASSGSRPLQGTARALTSTVATGVHVHLNSGRQEKAFRVGLRAQLAYEAATSLHFDATPMGEGEDALLVPTKSASLGSVNSSGLVLRLGFVGRF